MAGWHTHGQLLSTYALGDKPTKGLTSNPSKEGFEILADNGVVLCRDLPSGLIATEVDAPAVIRAVEQGLAEVVRRDELTRRAKGLLAVVEELHDAVGIEVGVARLAVALNGGEDFDSPLADSKENTEGGGNDG